MAGEEKKGITVKIDAELHAEVRQYLENHGMTMAEFITMAIDDELHPQIVEQEEKTVEKMRTLAFQVNEELFQKVKDYLHRNNMSQKEFVIGLIEAEIDRDLAEREALRLQQEAEMKAAEESADEEMDVTGNEEAASEKEGEGNYVEEKDSSSEAVELKDEEETFGDAVAVNEEVPNYSEETIEEATAEAAEEAEEETEEETDTDVLEEESDHEDVYEEIQDEDSVEETDAAEVYESGSDDEEDEVCDAELEDESEEDEEAEEEETTMCL